MKKLLSALLFACLLTPTGAWAAGTITETWTAIGDRDYVLKFTCVADASDGSFPSHETVKAVDGWVYLITTDPGSPAPTDDYDIVIKDSEGVDISGGMLANRDTSNSEQVIPKINNNYVSRRVYGPLTIEITSNSTNSALVVVSVYFNRGP